MNRISLKLSALLLAGFFLAACNKDDDEITPSVKPEFPTEFSELTVEQNKEKLEDNGIELVNEITQLKNTDGIQTAISLSDFLNTASPVENEGGRKLNSNKGIALIHALADFGKGRKSVADVLSGSRTNEEEQSLQENYDELVGVYAFNKTTNDWDVVSEGGGKIVFQFPSTKTGTSNDAEFTIFDYKGVQKPSDITGDAYTGDLPTAVKAELKVGGQKQLEYSFAASYNDKGEPTSVETSLILGAFKFSFDATNTTSDVGLNYALTHSNKNLVAFGASAKGNFTGTNANESDDIGSVVNTTAAYFQLLNVKFSGEVKVKELEQASNTAANVHAEAQAWNDFSTFVAFYDDSKKKIADVEFYGEEGSESETYCYEIDTDGDGFPDAEECETYEYPYESVDVRLIFADDSKSDLETYTEVGFADMENKLEEFFDAIESDLE